MQQLPKIRVFLSSTFKDMTVERNKLLKLFKRLEAYGSNRGVEISIIDLRWGITDEDAQNGKVISTCLQEIDNSRPFFIGLIGSRYGWQPTLEDLRCFPSLLERYPILDKYVHAKMSITEMEFRYGALESDYDAKAAFFIKDNLVFENDNHAKLISDIRSSGFRVSVYKDADDLCEQIRKILLSLIDELFPVAEMSQTQRSAITERNYYNFKYRDFYGNTQDEDYITAWIGSTSQGLAVIGPRGSGKTSTVLNWLHTSWKSNFAVTIFNVYVKEKVIKRLISEFRNLYLITTEIVPQQNSSEHELELLLKHIEKDGRLCIVFLDALNHLFLLEEKELLWFPPFPDNIKIIATTNQGDATEDALIRRRFEIFEIKELSHERRQEIIVKSLQKVGKKLSDTTIQQIVQTPLCGNVSILTALINEICAYGDHETLGKRIDFYLSADTQKKFYGKIIEILEDTFGIDLVEKVLLVLTLSKYGLHESEIIAVTGLKPLTWSEIYCWLKPHFLALQEEGCHIREAAIERYWTPNNNSLIRDLRTDLIKVVKNRDKSDLIAQYELAHQFASLEDWESLHILLMNLRLTFWLLVEFPNLLHQYWILLIKKTQYKLTDYISEGSEVIAGDINIDIFFIAKKMSDFISDYFSDYNTAIEFAKINLRYNIQKYGDNSENTSTSYNNIGLLYLELNDHEKAIEYLRKSLSISENIYGSDSIETIPTILNIGLSYYHSEDYTTAKDYFCYCVNYLEDNKHYDNDNLSFAYNNLGGTEDKLGNKDTALECYKKAYDLSRKLNGDYNIINYTNLRNVGLLLYELGRYQEACTCFSKLLDICMTLFGNQDNRTADCADSLANSYKGICNNEKALLYYQLAVDIQSRASNGWEDLTYFLFKCGEIELQMNLNRSAIEHLWLSFKIRLDKLGPDNEKTLRAARWLKKAYLENTQLELCRTLKYEYRQLEIDKLLNGFDSIYVNWFQIGKIYEEAKCYIRAAICFARRFDIEAKAEANRPDFVTLCEKRKKRKVRQLKTKFLRQKIRNYILRFLKFAQRK